MSLSNLEGKTPVQIFLTDEEYSLLEKAVKIKSLSKASFVRSASIEKARLILKEVTSDVK